MSEGWTLVNQISLSASTRQWKPNGRLPSQPAALYLPGSFTSTEKRLRSLLTS